jgi:replicative DNA helicase Mcm
MSRFDLICTMQDSPDEDTDEEIASGVLDSIDESARLDHGELTSENANHVTGEVPRDVMKAWVKIARSEIQPLLTSEAKAVLKEFYVDARQLNDEESDTPPATARKLVGGIRIAMAFARCELSETVEQRHAERAVNLSRSIIGKNFDPETGDFDANRTTETPSSQQERVQAITDCLRDEPKEIDEIVERTGLAQGTVEHRIEKLKERGEVYSPEMGKYLAT